MDKKRFHRSYSLPILFRNDGCPCIPMTLCIRGPDPGVVSCPVRMLSALQSATLQNQVKSRKTSRVSLAPKRNENHEEVYRRKYHIRVLRKSPCGPCEKSPDTTRRFLVVVRPCLTQSLAIPVPLSSQGLSRVSWAETRLDHSSRFPIACGCVPPLRSRCSLSWRWRVPSCHCLGAAR